MDKDKILINYTNPKNPGSLSGLSGFLKNNPKIKRKNALKVLQGDEVYTLHKPKLKKFATAKHIVGRIDQTWHLDLADVKNLRNKSLKQYYAYLLVCVDVLSKYAWVEPMENKESETCMKAFQKILFRSSPRKPLCVYMDKGREFMGSFTKYCNKNGIIQYFTNSENKACIAERFNRTLKEKLYRHFTFTKEKNYIKILQDVVDSYNNSYHRSIKTSPINVTHKNERNIYDILYSIDLSQIAKFKIGDYVRIALNKQLFEKGYTANWSREIFIVHYADTLSHPVKYSIKTLDGDIISNYFYQEQLQKVNLEEFPYDSFEVLREKEEYLLIRQINAEDSIQKWVPRSHFKSKSTEIEHEFGDQVEQTELINKDNNTKYSSNSVKKWIDLPKREGLRSLRHNVNNSK